MTSIHRQRPLFTNYQFGSKGSMKDTGSFEADRARKYFSSIDAEIYFGDHYIDEILNIQYTVSQNTLPLYGYNSYTFDDVAQGNRIVQGSFVINFTSAGFLLRLVDEIKKSRSSMRNSYTVEKSSEGTPEEFAVPGVSSSGDVPMWDVSFDIDVMFGQEDSLSGATHVIIQDAVITGCASQTDTSGNPIAESYSFIARDIRTVG